MAPWQWFSGVVVQWRLGGAVEAQWCSGEVAQWCYGAVV